MTLTDQQNNALTCFKEWFKYRDSEDLIFTLSGYAGTGKTVFIEYILNNPNEIDLKEDQIAVCAPTGKASCVLIKKGISKACTLHHLIYVPKEIEQDTIDENGGHHIEKKIIFVRKNELPDLYKLIIIDEVSMVDKYMLEDILRFKIPLLCVGDGFQLPSIREPHDLLLSPNYTLTDIVRQAADNPIIRLASDIRNGESLTVGNIGKNVAVIDSYAFYNNYNYLDIMLNADQVICGKNKTRKHLNNIIRDYLGYKDPLPQDGEKIMCVLNNWGIVFDEKYSLVNGVVGTAEGCTNLCDPTGLAKLTFKPDFVDDKIPNLIFDTGNFIDEEFIYPTGRTYFEYLTQTGQTKYTLFRPSAKAKDLLDIQNRNLGEGESKLINQFTFAYAASCHKLQGSEFDNILLFREFLYKEKDQNARWLYTGITRAKKNIIIVK